MPPMWSSAGSRKHRRHAGRRDFPRTSRCAIHHPGSTMRNLMVFILIGGFGVAESPCKENAGQKGS
jgi:hypothetical protein